MDINIETDTGVELGCVYAGVLKSEHDATTIESDDVSAFVISLDKLPAETKEIVIFMS